MEKKEMLDDLIAHYANGNKSQFAAKLGIKPQALSMWYTRNSFDAELIYTKCENVSGDWLLSGGIGSMFKSEHATSEEHDEIIRLRAENNAFREVIGLRKSGMADVG